MNLERMIAVRTSKIIYKDSNTVIKVFDSSYKKADVLNEALNQARVEEIGLDIPHIISVTKTNDKWAIVSEHIRGKTLAALIEENPTKTNEYLDLFVDLQLKMHQIKPPLLNKLKDKMNREIEASELNAITRYELRTRLDTMPRQSQLCHGDFVPSNIIITKDSLPYIIDWSHVTNGNVLADVAKTYILFLINNEVEIAQKYINLYCAKTNTNIVQIKKWVPLVAASLSVKSKGTKKELLLSLVDNDH
ncbi:aminoglycoside phosphotransferase family protein [Mycoplasmatota bacterium WC30]